VRAAKEHEAQLEASPATPPRVGRAGESGEREHNGQGRFEGQIGQSGPGSEECSSCKILGRGKAGSASRQHSARHQESRECSVRHLEKCHVVAMASKADSRLELWIVPEQNMWARTAMKSSKPDDGPLHSALTSSMAFERTR
jgi:hypothetical protein